MCHINLIFLTKIIATSYFQFKKKLHVVLLHVVLLVKEDIEIKIGYYYQYQPSHDLTDISI